LTDDEYSHAVSVSDLVLHCDFPEPGTAVALAVSGGPDSTGLLLLAEAAGLNITVHHVDHHARPDSGDDADFVQSLCAERGHGFIRHDVEVEPGPNFEQRARSARRSALPDGVLTGHTLDDVVESVLLNFLRGSGLTGLTPMHDDATKPLRRLRRSDVHQIVSDAGITARQDPTNTDPQFRRNQIRHDVVPLLNAVMERDVAPIIFRQSALLFEDRRWLESLCADDVLLSLEAADCRELATWPAPRLRYWLRGVLGTTSAFGDTYAPTSEEIERALAVVRGEVVACELSGGRRLSRRQQRLTLAE
jgi:tRNA(Ile)-lysidine synthase